MKFLLSENGHLGRTFCDFTCWFYVKNAIFEQKTDKKFPVMHAPPSETLAFPTAPMWRVLEPSLFNTREDV